MCIFEVTHLRQTVQADSNGNNSYLCLVWISIRAPNILAEVFHGFPQYLQIHSRIAPYNRPWPLLLLIVQLFSAL
jgi:hypothetical protein